MTRETKRTAMPVGATGGFTLIEMIVIVALVGLMTSIIAPVWRISPTRRVENQAYLLATQLELARTEALGERHMVLVQFDTANDQYAAFVDHDDDDSIAGIAAEVQAFPDFGRQQLDQFVEFGRGSASAVPGDVGVGSVTLANARLNLSDQGLPEPWGSMGTIYLVHSEDNTAVAAISVASSGSFKAWRWWPSPGEWR